MWSFKEGKISVQGRNIQNIFDNVYKGLPFPLQVQRR